MEADKLFLSVVGGIIIIGFIGFLLAQSALNTTNPQSNSSTPLPPAPAPQYFTSCPRMTDVSCPTAGGRTITTRTATASTFQGAALAVLARCETEHVACANSQLEEKSTNKLKCESAGCYFASRTVDGNCKLRYCEHIRRVGTEVEKCTYVNPNPELETPAEANCTVSPESSRQPVPAESAAWKCGAEPTYNETEYRCAQLYT